MSDYFRDKTMNTEWTKVKSIECLGEVEDYVYDLSVENNDPFFFANDVLVHNTDSCFFTANALKSAVEAGGFEWNKENIVTLYNNIAEQVNTSFPAFMEQNFHCTSSKGALIKANRELVADRGLFITKKRYALNVYDKDGKRKDIDGKIGEIKAMGLDLKRADTPKYVQEFLLDILTMVLSGKDRDHIVETIKKFKTYLSKQPGWTKGSPKSVNKLTYYNDLQTYSKTGDANLPGHVRASLNWNSLKKMNNDNYSMTIVDGMKIIVCKLKPNLLNMTSIAYPTDETRLPVWFINLPFDDKQMEFTLVDQKIENLLEVLCWDIQSSIDVDSTFNDLFTLG